MTQHGQHLHTILTEIEGGRVVSQRRLASRLGIALGLTNLLIRRVVAKGWVKVVHVQPNRVRYLLTPAGIAAKARLTREYLEGTLQFYSVARERVRERLAALSHELSANGGGRRIVFFGAGEIAEIAYVSLQETDLELVGVVDGARQKPFFGVAVHRPEELTAAGVNGIAFDRLVVMSVSDGDALRAELAATEVPPERVFWI
jgi:DNA-binding MarR family transcriptional regulator